MAVIIIQYIMMEEIEDGENKKMVKKFDRIWNKTENPNDGSWRGRHIRLKGKKVLESIE